MFERFTNRARQVVVRSQEEARRLRHNYIGTEHLLLGLLAESGGAAADGLKKLGVTLDAARLEVEKIIGLGEQGKVSSGHIPFTPRTKKVLELSLREALQLGNNYIGTQHLLLGLLREGEGVGVQILVRRGVDLQALRATVISLGPQQETEVESSLHLPLSPRRVAPPEIMAALQDIADRLSAIEAHLGITKAGPDQATSAPGAKAETEAEDQGSAGEQAHG